MSQEENEQIIENSSNQENTTTPIIGGGTDELGSISLSITPAENNTSNTPSGNISYSKDINGFSIQSNLGVAPKNINFHSESLSYNKVSAEGDLAVNASLENNNGEFGYNANINHKGEIGDEITTNTTLHSDMNDTYISIGVKRDLINPYNINNINNQDKLRKEELIETGEHFNLETKAGYSKEKGGLYTENSLMYRINNENFLNTGYTKSETAQTIFASADLKNIKIDYFNINEQKDAVETQTDALNIMGKGVKNQYNINVSRTEISKPDENELITKNRNWNIEAGMMFNRTEYGEFNSGFNGEIKTALSLNNENVNGYNVNLDGAWNYYGNEHGKTTDYLVRGRINFGEQDKVQNLSLSAGGDYRINHCNTIFETGIYHDRTKSPEFSENATSATFGVYQQVGKNFGDAMIFSKLNFGKKTIVTPENKSTGAFTELNVGARVKATKKIALNANAKVIGDKSVELGLRYTF